MVRVGSIKQSGNKVRGGNTSATKRAERLAALCEIPLGQIQLQHQPVRRFLGDIASLAASMQAYGLQQPISVRADGDKYILTSGLRRLTAAEMLGWTSIAAFVRSVSADESYVIDLVENLQREDLSPEEEADALVELVRTRGWTLDQVADAVKRSPGYVSKRVRLFEDPDLREAVLQHGLPVSTAELLLGIAAPHRSTLIERAVAERWDQMRVRDELQSAQSPVRELKQPRKLEPGTQPARRAAPGEADVPSAASRPPNFTRKVREFYRSILTIRTEDLTPADRSALRTLFKALVMLARAQTKPTPPVFPPLPSPSGSGRKRVRATASSRSRKR